MEKTKQFFKKEPVFVIAAVCAVASMFAVPPSAEYLGYIDLRVLELLFCLMAAVAGMQAEGSFLVLSQRLLTGKKSMRLLTMTLVMIPMNLIFTVHAFGVPHDVVMALMLPGIIPMNLIKSVVNCVLAGVLFKTLNPFLQKNRYLTQG